MKIKLGIKGKKSGTKRIKRLREKMEKRLESERIPELRLKGQI